MSDRLKFVLSLITFAGVVAAGTAGYLDMKSRLDNLGYSELPVGTIVAWTGDDVGELPDNWQVCDGNVGRPDLRDERFLMGVDLPDKRERKGSNDIDSEPNHDHGNVTGKYPLDGYRMIGGNTGSVKERITQPHDHTIHADGEHNHGGDKRPKYYGVVWIIKVK